MTAEKLSQRLTALLLVLAGLTLAGCDLFREERLEAYKTADCSQSFNTREGFTKADDTLPDRIFEPLENGALKGEKIDRQQFADARHDQRQDREVEQITGLELGNDLPMPFEQGAIIVFPVRQDSARRTLPGA